MAKKSKLQSEIIPTQSDLKIKKKKNKTKSVEATSEKEQNKPAKELGVKKKSKKSVEKKQKQNLKRKLVDAVDAGRPQTTHEVVDVDTTGGRKQKKKGKKWKGSTTDDTEAAGSANDDMVGAGEEPPKILAEHPEGTNQTTKKKKQKDAPAVDEAKDLPKKKKRKKPKAAGPGEANGEAEADGQQVEARSAPVALTTTDGISPARGDNGNGQEAAPKGINNTFRRVKSEEWIGKRGSMDNTYESTFGSAGWGFKAQQVLGQVRGKDFRHEKTKKKRGSYMGGKIDSTARFSFKYDSD